MRLPYGQDEMIRAVLDVNPNAAVVLFGGSPVDMSVWMHRARAVIWCWYAGMEDGRALAQVLLGDVNPSGKLPETFPKDYRESPAHRLGEFGNPQRAAHREGVMVGYRFYDTYHVEPEFCFGHGLSYTTFEYRQAEAAVTETPDGVFVRVEVTVRNSGPREGAEIGQVYVADREAGVPRPSQELKGFEKVFLRPGEEKTAAIFLKSDAFAWYDVQSEEYTVEPGEFMLRISSSSRDIRLERGVVVRRPYHYR